MKINGPILFGMMVSVATTITFLVWWFSEPVTTVEGADREVVFSWAKLTAYAMTAYIIFSFRFFDPIQADQIGVRLIFGKPTDVLDSGLPFVPLGIFELVKLDINVRQREFPAEPENIFRGELKDRESLPEGMKPPVRITFRDSVTEDEAKKLLGSDYKVKYEATGDMLEFVTSVPKDGLGRRVTAEVVPVVRWRIEDGINFIVNIGSTPEAEKQMEDEMFSVLQRLLPNMSVGQALQNIAWINIHLLNAVIRRTKNWGVSIEGAYLKSLPFHHALNKAIGDASEADFQGRAEKELLIRRGEGAAQAKHDLEKEELTGRGKGMKEYAELVGVDGESAQAADVARAVGEGGNAWIVGTEGLGQLFALGASAFKKRNSRDKDDGNGSTS